MEPSKDTVYKPTAQDSKITVYYTTLHTEVPETLGSYQIIRQIGRGGMGCVYEAVEKDLNRRVALKVLNATSESSPSIRQRFMNEALAAAQLHHDHVVPVYYIGEDAGKHFFTMMLIEGYDLGKIIKHARRASDQKLAPRETIQPQASLPAPSSGPKADTVREYAIDKSTELSAEIFADSMKRNGHRAAHLIAQRVARIGCQIADALHHAHQHGVIHRDVKPSNILMDQSGKAWITDFGLAQLQNASPLTQTGDVIGTWRYMSPEQASGRRAFLDHRTDIYSLGVALYELATLKSACRGSSAPEILRELTFERPLPVRKINPRLPADFETIICKSTERNPNDRYQTAAELSADLQRFLANQSITTQRTSTWRHWLDWMYERPRLIAVTTMGILMLMALLATTAWALSTKLTVSEALLDTSEALRRRAEAVVALVRDKNPGKALALATASAQTAPGFEADQTILAALDSLHELRRIDIGEAQPGELIFSPKGDQLLKCIDSSMYFDQRGVATIYNPDTGQVLAKLSHSQPITTAAFSPSGSILLTAGCSFPGSESGEDSSSAKRNYAFTPIAVWDVEQLTAKPQVLTQARSMRLVEDNFSRIQPRVVLPAKESDEAIVFSTEDWSREELRLRGGHTGRVLQSIFSPDGKWIATWSEDQTAVLWDAASGNSVKTLRYPTTTPAYASISFSPSSSTFMVNGSSGTRLFSVASEDTPEYFMQSYAKFSNVDDRLLLRSVSRSSLQIVKAPSAGPIQCESDASLDEAIWHDNGESLIAITDQNSNLRLFDAWDGSLQAICVGHSGWIVDIQSRPGTRQFASVAWDKSIRIWNSKSNAELRRMALDQRLVRPLMDVSPDKSQVAAASLTGMRSVFLPLDRQAPNVTSISGTVLAATDQGNLLLFDNGKAALFDPRKSQRVQEFVVAHDKLFQAHAIDGADDALLISEGGALLFLSAEQHRLTELLGLSHAVSAAAYRPSAKYVLVGTHNGRLLRVDLDTGQNQELAAFSSPVVHLDLDDQRGRLLICTDGGVLIVWDCETQKSLSTMRRDDRLSQAWFALDGGYAVSHAGEDNKTACLWDLASGQVDATLKAERVLDAHMSQDRRLIAFATQNDGTLVWDLEQRQSHIVTAQPSCDVQFSKDRLFVSTAQPKFLLLQTEKKAPGLVTPANVLEWNVNTRTIVSERFLGFAASSLHVLPGANLVVASGENKGAAVWDIETSRAVGEYYGHADALLAVSFQPDGKSLHTVSRDGTVLLHNTVDKSHRTLGRHEYPLSAAAISPDRSQLVTADTAGNAIQWDLQEGQQVRSRQLVKSGRLNQIVIAQNSSQIAALSDVGEVLWWDLRAWTVSRVALSRGAWQIAFSPDHSQILALVGERIVTIDRQLPNARSQDDASADAQVIDLKTRVTTDIRIDGRIVSAQYLPASNQLALLSDLGTLVLLDAKTFQPIRRIDPEPRVFHLLPTRDSDRKLYAVGNKYIVGWDSETGNQIFLMELTKAVSAVVPPPQQWTIHPSGSKWLFFDDSRGIAKVPIDPVAYAQSVAPWSVDPKKIEPLPR